MNFPISTIPIAYLYLSYWLEKSLEKAPPLSEFWENSLDADQAKSILTMLNQKTLVSRYSASCKLLNLEPQSLEESDVLSLLCTERDVWKALSCCFLTQNELHFKIQNRSLISKKLLEAEADVEFKQRLIQAYAIRWGWSVQEYIGSYTRVLLSNEVFQTSFTSCSCSSKQESSSLGCYHQEFIKLILANRSQYSFLLEQFNV